MAKRDYYEILGVSRNASATQPARLLVWMLLDEKAPVLTPLKQ